MHKTMHFYVYICLWKCLGKSGMTHVKLIIAFKVESETRRLQQGNGYLYCLNFFKKTKWSTHTLLGQIK